MECAKEQVAAIDRGCREMGADTEGIVTMDATWSTVHRTSCVAVGLRLYEVLTRDQGTKHAKQSFASMTGVHQLHTY